MARHTRRLITWIGWGALALAVLVALAVLALVWFADPNAWRARIAQAASNSLGRQVQLGGDLHWDIGWNIAIASEGGIIANAPGFDATPFAQWQRMRFGLNARALLGKRIVIDQLAIDGLKVNLQRNAAGKGNWRFAQADAASATAAAADKPMQLRIASLQLRNSQLAFSDARGAAAGEVPGAASASVWQLADLALDVDLPPDLNAPARTLRNVVLHGRLHGGGLPAQGVAVAFEAAALQHDAATSALDVPAFKASWDDALLSGGVQAMLGAQPVARGKLAVRVPSLRTQLTQLGIALPPMADPKTLGKLEVEGVFDLKGSSLAVTDLKAALDATQLGGTVTVTQFTPLALRFDLEGDSIDFDRYLEPADYKGKPFALPLAQLKAFNVQGALRMKSAIVVGARATELRLDVE